MFSDAHAHWHFPELRETESEWLPAVKALPARAVVNGTHPDDWEAVRALAGRLPFVVPSYGVHPWRAREVAGETNWLETLRALLTDEPAAGVGEIGLDLWMRDPDREAQETAFLAQWRLAVERNRPVSVHCLKAWTWLGDLLSGESIPAKGWMLHGFGGDWATAKRFLDFGAFLSFQPSMMAERKVFVREAFAKAPRNRILVETDSPSMTPPDAWNRIRFTSRTGDETQERHHPANIVAACAALAETLGEEEGRLRETLNANFETLFLS